MGRKLYVGNLSFETGSDELRLAFSQCGSVTESLIITDRETGRSRGFGFITMSSDEEARSAVQRWSGSTLDGRRLKVSEAVERTRSAGPVRTARTAQGPSGGGHAPGDGGRKDGRKRRGRDRERERDYG
jgi:cold-inducible RNA-binding protein